jgi:hypothetical protein
MEGLDLPRAVVARASGGDATAIRELNRALAPWLLEKALFLACGSFRPEGPAERMIAHAARGLDRERRADAAREAVVRTLRVFSDDGGASAWARLDPARPVAPFAAGALKHVLARVLEREALHVRMLARDGALPDRPEPRDPERTVAARDTLARVLADVRRLPPRQRAAIERTIREELEPSPRARREPHGAHVARSHARRKLRLAYAAP